MELKPAEEELLRRFLVGRVTDQERERVESRFAIDPDYFEAMCALESELMLDYAQGRLRPDLADDFRTNVLSVPSRHQRLDDLAAFGRALADISPPQPMVTPGRWWTRRSIGLLAAAAVLVLAVTVVTIGRRAPGVADGPTTDVKTTPQLSARLSDAEFVLQPGNTRSADESQRNVFALEPGVSRVVFRVAIPGATDPSVRVEVRRVGADVVSLDGDPEARVTAGGLDVRCTLRRAQLSRGDYVLTVTPGAGGVEALTTRVFTIDE